eukprot:2690242-Rhodomonas_salina.1
MSARSSCPRPLLPELGKQHAMHRRRHATGRRACVLTRPASSQSMQRWVSETLTRMGDRHAYAPRSPRLPTCSGRRRIAAREAERGTARGGQGGERDAQPEVEEEDGDLGSPVVDGAHEVHGPVEHVLARAGHDHKVPVAPVLPAQTLLPPDLCGPPTLRRQALARQRDAAC